MTSSQARSPIDQAKNRRAGNLKSSNGLVYTKLDLLTAYYITPLFVCQAIPRSRRILFCRVHWENFNKTLYEDAGASAVQLIPGALDHLAAQEIPGAGFIAACFADLRGL